jgi:hypothetical protein
MATVKSQERTRCPMTPKAIVRVSLTERATRVLVTEPSGSEVLKAHFPSTCGAHRLATRTLLEAVAHLCNARLHVVLSAESEAIGFAQGLVDGIGLGMDTVYYDVELLPRGEGRRRLRGLGDFRDLRGLRVIPGGKP